ncbi:hypothetical protein ABZ871_38190 [Streptomyces populi]
MHRWRHWHHMRTWPPISVRDKLRLCLTDVRPQPSFWKLAREYREQNGGRRP